MICCSGIKEKNFFLHYEVCLVQLFCCLVLRHPWATCSPRTCSAWPLGQFVIIKETIPWTVIVWNKLKVCWVTNNFATCHNLAQLSSSLLQDPCSVACCIISFWYICYFTSMCSLVPAPWLSTSAKKSIFKKFKLSDPNQGFLYLQLWSIWFKHKLIINSLINGHQFFVNSFNGKSCLISLRYHWIYIYLISLVFHLLIFLTKTSWWSSELKMPSSLNCKFKEVVFNIWFMHIKIEVNTYVN